MTPAEHARLIDMQEFEAECRAVRQRLHAWLDAKRVEDRARVQRAIPKPVQPGRFKHPCAVLPTTPAAPKPTHVPKRSNNCRVHSIAGRSLTRRQWAEELGMTYNNMNQHVPKLGSVEAVVIHRLGGSVNG